MTIYKTPDNTLHDDMGGAALSLPSWPRDAKTITNEEADAIRSASITALPQQQMIQQVMLGMKSKRLDIFRVLDTLQVDALTANKQPQAQAIMQAKTAMTALNNIDLSGYQTAEAMEQAIQYAYWTIVSQAPQEVQDAFNALVPR